MHIKSMHAIFISTATIKKIGYPVMSNMKMARAGFFEAQTAHGPEPLTQ